MRRILYGCVDWNMMTSSILLSIVRRILYGCVDWNFLELSPFTGLFVASYTGAWIETFRRYKAPIMRSSRILYGCVDWNSATELEPKVDGGRILYGCVDWNKKFSHISQNMDVASYTGAWIETEQRKQKDLLFDTSHPIRVRGLKLCWTCKG